MNNAATRMIVKSLSVIRNEAVRFFACVFFDFIFILLSNVYFPKHAAVIVPVCLGKYAFTAHPRAPANAGALSSVQLCFIFRTDSGQNIAVLNDSIIQFQISEPFFSWRSELLLRRSRGRNRQRRTWLCRCRRWKEGRYHCGFRPQPGPVRLQG